MPDFDMLVIGSGPGGQKAAIAAAKLGRRVAVVDSPEMVGGVSIHTGTIPSKTLREAVLYLTGLTHRDLYSRSTPPGVSSGPVIMPILRRPTASR
ncbi:FAD-dependent oxidoreductase, partial [Streptomyces sp. NPDC007162]|uniref:FAD-dependent oxidoreductase n=1 Tax=Streptomyces sp. NPDC007162 TaxID=3156917 RepID=UPI00340F22A2